MECCKLIASFFVVFIHVRFPGSFGDVMSCLAGFAVPVFFAISGYFNYQATSQQVAKRFVHILKLNLSAFLLHVLWGCIVTEYHGGSTVSYVRSLTPNQGWLAPFLALCEHPFYEQHHEHLWYLIAIGICYAVFWVYTRFFEHTEISYRPLYTVGAFLLLTNLLMGEFASLCGIQISYLMTRNALTLGLPMFTLGIFLQEYRQRILLNFQLTSGKLVILIIAAMIASIMEWQRASGAICISIVIAVIGIVLLCAEHPRISGSSKLLERIFAKFGFLSTMVYILHTIMLEFYTLFCQQSVYLLIGNWEVYLRPVFIVLLSLLAGLICDFLLRLIRRFFKKG